MPNDYLVEIHDYLSETLEKLNQDRKAAPGDGKKSTCFMDGQIEEIRMFREFMTKNYDLSSYSYY